MIKLTLAAEDSSIDLTFVGRITSGVKGDDFGCDKTLAKGAVNLSVSKREETVPSITYSLMLVNII